MSEIALWVAFVIFAVTISPQLILGVLRVCFGFGLGQKRALVSILLFAVAAGFWTPMIMEGRGFWASEEWRQHHDPERFLAEHLLYGLDKMLPVVSSSIDFYPASRHSGVTVTGQHHVHGHVTRHPNFFAWLDMMWELVGWVIFAATAFTLSGFVRRDTER